MKKVLSIYQGMLYSLSLETLSWVEKRSRRYNPAFVFSTIFHMVIFIALFVSFSSKYNVNSTQFMPIGVEIADFRAGSLVKNYGNNKKSDKIIAKKSENGEKFIENNNSGQSTLTQQSRISKYNSYVELIAHELERRKSRFSMDNAPKDMKVTVVFEVNLDEAGNLKSYKVVKNSGHKFFDSVATKIITASGHFPTPPSDIKSMGLTFSIPIIFDSLS